jgi:hypothetical protein
MTVVTFILLQEFRDPNAIMVHSMPVEPALIFPSFLNISGK